MNTTNNDWKTRHVRVPCFFTDDGWERGGITLRYKVMLAASGVNKHLGYFSTPEEAFLVYKQAKEFNIKLIAEQYKDAIDVRVYDALKNWEVSIND